MLTGLESSTPVIEFSTPEGAHAEAYTIQWRPFTENLNRLRQCQRTRCHSLLGTVHF